MWPAVIGAIGSGLGSLKGGSNSGPAGDSGYNTVVSGGQNGELVSTGKLAIVAGAVIVGIVVWKGMK